MDNLQKKLRNRADPHHLMSMNILPGELTYMYVCIVQAVMVSMCVRFNVGITSKVMHI